MGVLFAAAATYALIRALASTRRGTVWWASYGLLAAASLYTHNFALFTVPAQVLGTMGIILWRRSGRAEGQMNGPSWKSALGGLLGATGLAVVLYSPWIAPFIAQVRRVQQYFWIDPPTWATATSLFTGWAIGIGEGTYTGWFPVAVCLVVAASVLVAVRLPAAALVLLPQAVLPWAAAIAISTWGERPLLRDRYLVFANLAWLGVLGTAAAALPRAWLQVLLAVCCLVPMGVGAGHLLARRADDWPGLADAARAIKDHYRPGDVILVAGPAPINQLRYYLRGPDEARYDVRTLHRPIASTAQESHISTLLADELLWAAEDPPPEITRIGAVGYITSRWTSVPASWTQLALPQDSRPPLRDARISVALFERPGGRGDSH